MGDVFVVKEDLCFSRIVEDVLVFCSDEGGGEVYLEKGDRCVVGDYDVSKPFSLFDLVCRDGGEISAFAMEIQDGEMFERVVGGSVGSKGFVRGRFGGE